MNMPGELVIIKMWESLVDKGIGGLLLPWQIRRVGRANADAKRDELLRLADAERVAVQLRRGELELPGEGTPPLLTRANTAHDSTPATRLPIQAHVKRSVLADATQREISIAKAVLGAEDELVTNEGEPPEDAPSADWLYRWRDIAGGIASDDLLRLWGRVLAGEICTPGRYSIRTLEFLRGLSRDEAKRIEKVAPFIIQDFIWRPATSLSDFPGFVCLTIMQELGLVDGIDAGRNLDMKPNGPDGRIIIPYHGQGMMVDVAPGPDSSKATSLRIQIYTVTTVGRQVFGLPAITPKYDMFNRFAQHLADRGYTVLIGDLKRTSDGKAQIIGPQIVSKGAGPV
jgi:hypothetical protein